MLKTFEDIKNALIEKGYNVVKSGDNYLKVQDIEGFKAYFQMDTYGYSTDISRVMSEGFTFSTVHKANKKTGTGRRTFAIDPVRSIETIELYLNETLKKSKQNIMSGKEKAV